MVIPLTHHKNGGFTELKVVGVYLFVYSIFSWCAKGIVILNKIKLFSNDKKDFFTLEEVFFVT